MTQESSTARLVRLIINMNPDRQFDLLKEVLGGGIESHLLRLVLDLPEERKRTLLEQARNIQQEHGPLSPEGEKGACVGMAEPPAPAEAEPPAPEEDGSMEEGESLPRIGEREHPRSECEIPVGYAGEELSAYGMARDISVGGMRMDTSADLKVGQQLQMNFPLPGGEITVRTTCRVIRVDRTGVAVAFMDLAPWIVEQIRKITGRP